MTEKEMLELAHRYGYLNETGYKRYVGFLKLDIIDFKEPIKEQIPDDPDKKDCRECMRSPCPNPELKGGQNHKCKHYTEDFDGIELDEGEDKNPAL